MKTDYKAELNKRYFREQCRDGCPPQNKLEFLGGSVFDFTTYDNSVDELFATKMLEVIDCILNTTAFDYQKDEDNYVNYLIMVNMPFLQGMLEWGMSIRSAWFDEYGVVGEKVNVYEITYDWKIPKKDIKEFMKQLLEWSKELDMNKPETE